MGNLHTHTVPKGKGVTSGRPLYGQYVRKKDLLRREETANYDPGSGVSVGCKAPQRSGGEELRGWRGSTD